MKKSDLATAVVDFGTTKSNPRGNNKIIGITPHHMAGKMTAEACAKSHRDNANISSSANYYIGYDGTICAGVSEDRRAWTSANRNNDYTHITFEVSNDGGAPDWHISDASYKALVRLCADICKRYDIKPHFTGKPDGTITYHQMFANTDCPGPYLKNLIDSGKFESDIQQAMGGKTVQTDTAPIVAPTSQTLNLKQGDIIKLKEGATYYNGKAIPSWVVKSKLYYRGVNNNGVIISTLQEGSITGVVKPEDIIQSNQETKIEQPSSYTTKITVSSLNVRTGPGTNHPVTTVVSKNEVFTIVDEENGWGLLKSYQSNRNGWIYLKYTQKI